MTPEMMTWMWISIRLRGNITSNGWTRWLGTHLVPLEMVLTENIQVLARLFPHGLQNGSSSARQRSTMGQAAAARIRWGWIENCLSTTQIQFGLWPVSPIPPTCIDLSNEQLSLLLLFIFLYFSLSFFNCYVIFIIFSGLCALYMYTYVCINIYLILHSIVHMYSLRVDWTVLV